MRGPSRHAKLRPVSHLRGLHRSPVRPVVGSAGEDGLVQGDLVELLQTPEARVSLLVHELGERGLVDTVRTAPDRRVVRVGITAEGSRLVRAALEAQRAALREVAREFAMPGVGEMLRNAMQLYLGVDISVEGLG